MFVFGLTGGIASGKTLVSSYLQQLGCPIVDADVIARQVVEPGQPAWKAVIGNFGVDILQKDSTIDRPKLAKMIFEDDSKRHLLNACTHPFIQKAIIMQLIKHFVKGEPFVVLVSPLLYETNKFLWLFKRIIVVNCNPEEQLQRLMTRDSLSQDEAQQRIAAQMPLVNKCRRANFVIDNSREVRFTQQQAFTLYHRMRRMSRLCGLYRWIIFAVVGIIVGRLLYIYLR